jgi:four helix bundle protein
MKRALDGVVLAIAEGAGRGSGRDRARFYSMALASGYEAMGCLDLLAAHGAEDPDLARCLATLERLLAMVAGLVRRPA